METTDVVLGSSRRTTRPRDDPVGMDIRRTGSHCWKVGVFDRTHPDSPGTHTGISGYRKTQDERGRPRHGNRSHPFHDRPPVKKEKTIRLVEKENPGGPLGPDGQGGGVWWVSSQDCLTESRTESNGQGPNPSTEEGSRERSPYSPHPRRGRRDRSGGSKDYRDTVWTSFPLRFSQTWVLVFTCGDSTFASFRRT